MDDRATLEAEVCTSAITFLAERKSHPGPTFVRRPDTIERSTQAVDRSFQIGNVHYVLEHTRIEVYPGRIYDNEISSYLSRQLRGLLGEGFLPDSELHLVMENPLPISRPRLPDILPSLSEWIRRKAPELEYGNSENAPRHCVQETIPDLGFTVKLCRWPSKVPRLVIAGESPTPELLKKRLEIAVSKKLPKLAQARTDEDIRSVLVLEHRDIQAGAPADIAQSFRLAVENSKHAPPDIVLLFESDHWSIWVLREGNKWLPLYSLSCHAAPSSP